MAKKGNNELNKDEKLKHVAEGSKKIVKKEKQSQVAKKKQNNKPKGVAKAGAVQSPTKKVKSAEDLAAKLAIKRAKKAAQKLKKQLKRESYVKVENIKTEEGATKKVQAAKTNAPKKLQAPKPGVQKKLKTAKDGSPKKAKKPKIERVPRVPGPDDDESTVFVGNLPVNTKRVQLMKVFDEYGPVKSIRFRSASGKLIFKHKMRKQSGGLIAYVLLKDAETAEKALALNNIEFKGNHLRVTKATDKSPMDPKRTVFVGNLKYSANEEKLREIFSSCGEIEYVRCLQASPEQIAAKTERNLKAGCKGVAYICFKSPEAVGLALELKETLLDDRPINVERYSLKKIEVTKTRKEEEQQMTQTTKKNKKDGKKVAIKKEKTEGTDNDVKKKTVFHGVKVEHTKKKNKSKADKKLKALAKKVAPKTLLQK